MYLFKDGVHAYLDFFRNLSVQYLFFASAGITAAPLDITSCCYYENSSQTFMFVFFMAISLYASIGNAAVLLGKLFKYYKLDKALRLIRLQGKTGSHKTWAILEFTKRRNVTIFFEVIFIYFLAIFCLAMVMALGMFFAKTYIAALHK